MHIKCPKLFRGLCFISPFVLGRSPECVGVTSAIKMPRFISLLTSRSASRELRSLKSFVVSLFCFEARAEVE